MKSLFDSVREFIASLSIGQKLNYISGQNVLEVLSASESGDWVKLKRESSGADTSVYTVNLSALQEVIIELDKGQPVHFETFFHGGGNLRTVYETLLAYSPRIAWCKINNQKHLQAFGHEVHPPCHLWNSGSDEWSSPEWALATIIFLDVVWQKKMSTIPVPIPALLDQVTSRNAKSWQARIANLRSSSGEGGFTGGEVTRELCKFWIERYAAEPAVVKYLAGYAVKIDSPQPLTEKLGELIGMDFKSKRVEFGILGGLAPLDPLGLTLLAKPFTILTGNSGTGKTRSAEELAAMFRDADNLKLAKNVALVAVGADWTDNRNVVGYVNHLREIEVDGHTRPVYQSTPVLDLLLEASKPGREAVPHFLILDEMNLSHVERYFADFLSAMEARSGAIRLHLEGDFRLPRFEGDTVGVPQLLPYPANLFVIGTVNVDETTYMFSPKVLDRAHVIEFQVAPDEVGKFLEDPKPLQPVPRAAAGQAEAFLELSLRARGAKEPPLPELAPAVKTAVNKHLLEVLEILQNGRFEFAFRTAKEVVAYLKVSCELASDKTAWDVGAVLTEEERVRGMTSWKADLDDEILQKILPRLHGSRTRVGPLLGALGWYLHSGDKAEAEKFFPAPGEELPEKPVQEIIALHKAAAAFPRSFAKVQRMARVVIEEQFVSFIC